MIFAQVPLVPEQASTLAPKVDGVFIYLTSITVFFTVLIAILIIYFAIKYRRRQPSESGEQVHGSLALEVTWTVIPLILVLVSFVWGSAVYFDMMTAPDDALEVYVVAKQWMWFVQHQGGQRENQELHVPVGRPVKLIMISQDVIHNFAVPAFRVKQDVLPGRYSTLWFTATKPGRYPLFCAEYCGTNHSKMVGWVTALEPSKYEAWLASATVDGSPANKGRKLFLQLQCIACHHREAGNKGPLLEEIYNKTVPLADGESILVTEEYLRESILHPEAKVAAGFKPIMPSYKGQVTEPELLELIAFLKSLKSGETPLRTEATDAPEFAPPK